MDYHFYRQDSDGYWSHKPGGDLVIDLDGDGRKVLDPKKCNRINQTNPSLNYEEFIGFYAVTQILC